MDNTNTIIVVVASVISVVVGAILGGGTVLVVVGNVADRVLNSPAILASIEKLASSIPPELLANINQGAQDAEKIAKILDLLTDGKPTIVPTTTVTAETATVNVPPAPVPAANPPSGA